MDVNEYKDMFLAEAREYLQALNESLLKLEWEPENGELVQIMFRSAHSLKGMAATMNYQDVTKLTHEMENILQFLREGNLNMKSELADILFLSLDSLESLLAKIENPQLPDPCVLQVVEKIHEFLKIQGDGNVNDSSLSELQERDLLQNNNRIHFELEEFEKEIIKDAVIRGDTVYTIDVNLLEDSLLKSVRAYMVIKALEEQGVLLKTKPPISDIEEDNFGCSFAVLYQCNASDEYIRSVIDGISEIESFSVMPLPVETLQEQAVPAIEQAEADKKVAHEQQNAVSISSKEKTVRVDTGKLDGLINLVGELVTNRTRILELSKDTSDQAMATASEQLSHITVELQSAVMKLRMVPIKQVFDRFPRMVRDLSKEKGKNICFEIYGEETELDRSIVNQIGEPLVHLIRNAVDHGIESAQERLQANKVPEGRVTLAARYEGSYISIEVRDDGRGLDKEKLVHKALQKELITPEEAANFKGADAYNLIFKNGFSTAEQITDTSGRGVGMDAVKSMVESLNGIIEVNSELGLGTCITLRLPLTLAIIKALLVKAGGEVYAIPVESIRENLLIPIEDIKNVNKQKVISLRSEVIPVLSLDMCLQCRDNLDWFSDDLPAVIVMSGEKKVGLLVDELIGQQEVVIKPLGKILGRRKGIAGATILGNGNVALILNVSTLI